MQIVSEASQPRFSLLDPPFNAIIYAHAHHVVATHASFLTSGLKSRFLSLVGACARDQLTTSGFYEVPQPSSSLVGLVLSTIQYRPPPLQYLPAVPDMPVYIR